MAGDAITGATGGLGGRVARRLAEFLRRNPASYLHLLPA
jgi:uncharacterized protein YbjT (DUF2867 family)